MIPIAIDIKGFQFFRLGQTLFDNVLSHQAPRAFRIEANDFELSITGIFEDRVNDTNAFELPEVNGFKVLIRSEVNQVRIF